MVQRVKVAVPAFSMPPFSTPAVLPLIVLSVMVSVPKLFSMPPTKSSEELLLTVQSVSVSVPPSAYRPPHVVAIAPGPRGRRRCCPSLCCR